MRWDSLLASEEEEHQLPGYRDAAVIRRFDVPEAMDIRFYEVRAKSILNRVPKSSPMPFSWTINPYRGCSHACAYCGSGDTRVLLASGETKALAEVQVGDRVVGTQGADPQRRLVPTRVIDAWAVRKPAYRVTLSDGTTLITSGAHRFLAAGAWKHVAAGACDCAQGSLVNDDLLAGVPADAAAGDAVAWDRSRLVVSIEPLGLEMDLYDIATGTGDFIANGVVSHNCFARPTHKFLDFNAGRDFEREIVVKVNAPERARAELSRPSWKHEHVAMGTNTDPYQWVEGRYKLMPGIWEALRDTATPCSVLTKSPLVLRDLDLLKEIAQVTSISASFSVPTLDEKVWRQTEPHTPHPRARLEALAEIRKAGIPSSVLIAPIMPGVNDSPKQLEPLLEMAAEAGATNVVPIALHLRGEVKGLWFDWLREYRPDLLERYEQLYPRGAYMSPADRDRTTEFARTHRRTRTARTRPALGRSYAPHRNDPAPRPADGDACAPARAPEPQQVSLF